MTCLPMICTATHFDNQGMMPSWSYLYPVLDVVGVLFLLSSLSNRPSPLEYRFKFL